MLLATLADWAKSRGDLQVWVATGDAAVAFYIDCGWEAIETFTRASGEMTTVLVKHL